jgi:hypothetical protein
MLLIGELMQKTIGIILLALGSSVAAMAATVPEIDPASGASALSLLAGGILVVRGRKK